MASELIYTPYPAGIARFLRHVQSAGIPDKVTVKYLEQVSFKSKNDRALIPIVKAIGFVDPSGTPTDRWRAFRDKSQAKGVMAAALRTAYGALFTTYPDAPRKDTEALHNFFSVRSGVSESTVKLAVATFKALASEAEFDGPVSVAPTSTESASATETVPTAVPSSIPGNSSAVGATINVNIELHLPATQEAEIYDALFGALRKHVLNR